MINKKLIIASSSQDEAITKYILNNKQKFDLDIEILLLNDLLTKYDINDEVNDNEAIVRWIKPNGQVISNTDYILLNRVTFIPDSMFFKFIEKDRLYARSEFEAYLGFAFNSFIGVGNTVYNGVCTKTSSLPEQWLKVKDMDDMSIPVFYWGPKEFQNDEDDLFIYSEIDNLLNWRDSYITEVKEHIFCFKKPIGTPIFTFNIGNETLINDDSNLSKTMRAKLQVLSSKIQKKFDYFISEILFFINGDTITFGCINHEVIETVKNRQFNDFIYDNLIKEYFKCVSLNLL
jgi:hypothetical protein